MADEQTVACRWRCEATHSATNNPIDIHAADFFTVRDGRLAVLRRFLDSQHARPSDVTTGGDNPPDRGNSPTVLAPRQPLVVVRTRQLNVGQDVRRCFVEWVPAYRST